jgi:Phosphopantetheine attachment site
VSLFPCVIRPLLPAGAVELRNEVGRAVALELPSTLVFDYPTIDAIVEYIGGKVAAAAPGVAAPVQEQVVQVSQ